MLSLGSVDGGTIWSWLTVAMYFPVPYSMRNFKPDVVFRIDRMTPTSLRPENNLKWMVSPTFGVLCITNECLEKSLLQEETGWQDSTELVNFTFNGVRQALFGPLCRRVGIRQ